MSGYLPDSPDLSENWCPTCQPERDPSREILQVKYCFLHIPTRVGVDDEGVTGEAEYGTNPGIRESDGAANRRMSELLNEEQP